MRVIPSERRAVHFFGSSGTEIILNSRTFDPE